MEGTACITKIVKERHEEPVTVYNLAVKDWMSYFVGQVRVYVHNGIGYDGGSSSHKQNLDGLNEVRKHLTNDVDGLDFEPNNAMMGKIEKMLSNGQKLTGAYKDFYEHELT